MDTILPLLEAAANSKTAIETCSEETKRQILLLLANKLNNAVLQIIAENQKDLDAMPASDPKKDRLLLNESRIKDLSASMLEISQLPNPANQLLVEKTMPNGLFIQKKTVPLGVVGVIYESRPNVTVDVAALCIRSGNVCVLRGGTDAFHTNKILVSFIKESLHENGIDENAVVLLPPDRKYVSELLNAVQYVDIIIPRGSQQLINFVRENAKVPVIETGAGVCHTYIEASADLEKAASIVVNAKTSRPSVCNSLDTILIDEIVATEFLTLVSTGLKNYQVDIFADEVSYVILENLNYPFLQHADEEDFGREFLDFKCSVKTVFGINDALKHIRKYSSKHSEAIVSENNSLCERFLNEVDAAAVYTNASTRFTDGGVFGLGAEIGISTQKLHARGPFALEKLVTEKWLIKGNGQIR